MNKRDRDNIADALYWIKAGMYNADRNIRFKNCSKSKDIMEKLIKEYDRQHPTKVTIIR
jgi:hypothetical protein